MVAMMPVSNSSVINAESSSKCPGKGEERQAMRR